MIHTFKVVVSTKGKIANIELFLDNVGLTVTVAENDNNLAFEISIAIHQITYSILKAFKIANVPFESQIAYFAEVNGVKYPVYPEEGYLIENLVAKRLKEG